MKAWEHFQQRQVLLNQCLSLFLLENNALRRCEKLF